MMLVNISYQLISVNIGLKEPVFAYQVKQEFPANQTLWADIDIPIYVLDLVFLQQTCFYDSLLLSFSSSLCCYYYVCISLVIQSEVIITTLVLQLLLGAGRRKMNKEMWFIFLASHFCFVDNIFMFLSTVLSLYLHTFISIHFYFKCISMCGLCIYYLTQLLFNQLIKEGRK